MTATASAYAIPWYLWPTLAIVCMAFGMIVYEIIVASIPHDPWEDCDRPIEWADEVLPEDAPKG